MNENTKAQNVDEAWDNLNKKDDDEMYEGGETTDPLNEESQISDPDDEYDIDNESDDDEKKVCSKHKFVIDWRNEHGFFGAYFKGHLRKNDY